jgi:hypothetical protein
MPCVGGDAGVEGAALAGVGTAGALVVEGAGPDGRGASVITGRTEPRGAGDDRCVCGWDGGPPAEVPIDSAPSGCDARPVELGPLAVRVSAAAVGTPACRVPVRDSRTMIVAPPRDATSAIGSTAFVATPDAPASRPRLSDRRRTKAGASISPSADLNGLWLREMVFLARCKVDVTVATVRPSSSAISS